MKRDMNLVLELLEFLENREDLDVISDLGEIPIEGRSEVEIDYHLCRMYEAGLITGEPIQTKTGRLIHVWPYELTWEGHEFLDAMRDETVARRIKDKFGEMPFSVLKELALSIVRNQTGLT